MADKRSGALRALGLAKKAGALIVGTPLVCKALGGKHPPVLTVVSAYASQNTKKRLYDKCTFYNIPIFVLDESTDDISSALGGDAQVAACAIAEQGLARLICEKVERDKRTDNESEIY